MTSRAFAIKRISKDFKEIEENPLEGVGICFVDKNDPFQLLVNIKILQGRYKDLIVHIMLFLPEQYPCKPPRMLLLPGQCYDHSFHHHIYPDQLEGYFKFCIDLLDAAIMNSNAIGSGWSPAYTFCTLLMQIQNFLADPDFHSKAEELTNETLQKLRSQMNDYQYTHNINGKKQVHSTKAPYPPLHVPMKTLKEVVNETKEADSTNNKNAKKGKNTKNDENKGKEQEQSTEAQEIKLKQLNSERQISMMQQIHQRSSCFMTKDSFINNPTGIYGYPIMVTKDKFNRLMQKAEPEMLSYEGFQSQLEMHGLKGVNLQFSYKTGLGEAYNAFIPVFLNEAHFKQSRKVLEKCLNEISSEMHFERQVLEILPNIINKMLVALLKGTMYQSIAAIEAYIHFTQLFHYLVKDNNALRNDVQNMVTKIVQGDHARSKKQLGDIGEFLVILSASNYARTPELLDLLYREYFARQIMWMPQNNQIQKFQNLKEDSSRMPFVFTCASVSNQLLIFNIEAATKFADNKNYLESLAKERLSFISETDAEAFIRNTNKIIKQTTNHVQLMKYLGLEHLYPTAESCYNAFKLAIYVSNIQKYSNLDINLCKQQKQIQPEVLNITGSLKQPEYSVNPFVLKEKWEEMQLKKAASLQVKSQSKTEEVQQQQQPKQQQPQQQKFMETAEESEWNTVIDKKKHEPKDNEELAQSRYDTISTLKNKTQKGKNNIFNKTNENNQDSGDDGSFDNEKVAKKEEYDGWNVVVDKKKHN